MLFGKSSLADAERLVGDILDHLDGLVVVARGEDCRALYLNDAARERIGRSQLDPDSCRTGCGALFPALCDRCPNREGDSGGDPGSFEMQDEHGRYHLITARPVTWLDSKPATMLLLQDVDDTRGAAKRLFHLAYMDQLTNVPNRTKLKEDFEKVRARGNLCGAVALFDMDNFKAVNDTYGHNTGDIMLRRLTEHLNQPSTFAGHLYRLGGDEFILLYAEEPGRFADEEAMRSHYGKLFRNAFYSYTMPNIELSCTISMGVAFFPLHGTSLSDMLRKSDIALYEAKTGGRNRMVFFEDRYDNAKKFEDYYVSIQPILTEDGKTYGYELLDNTKKTEEQGINLGEFDRAIDALGLGDLENEAKYFITQSNKLSSKAVLNNLPRNKFVIQLTLPDKMFAAELENLKELYAYGYSLALDGLGDDAWTEQLLALADYYKFAPQLPEEARRAIIKRNPKKTFIATGINSLEAKNEARRAGYRLFQGNFFNQPVVVKKEKDISPLKANYLRLLKMTSTDEYVDFAQISDIIASDVALSYKLLRLLNSAAVGLRNRISSIAMAVSYLGEESLKKWIALLALRGVADDKPLELIRMSLIRAQFGELLAPQMKPRREAKHVFLAGMFSLLHIALDKSQEELFAEIPMAEDIRLSLTTEDGVYSDMIAFYAHYEYANWDEVNRFADKNGLSSEMISNAYIRSVKWYNDLAQ